MQNENLKSIIESLHPLEIKVLFALESGKSIGDSQLVEKASIEQAQKDMAIGWLLAKGIIKVIDEAVEKSVILTETGEKYRDLKVPELRIFQAIKDNPECTMADIKGRADLDPTEVSSAIGALKDSGIIKIAQGGRFEIVDSTLIDEYERSQNLITTVSNRGEIKLSELSQNVS